MKCIYISGPMSGIEDYNFPVFRAAAARLRELDYFVVSPHEFANVGKTWEDCLRFDLIQLCLSADTLALLPGWKSSRGANLEYDVAERLGMKIVLIEEITERYKP
jgi:hypothetical protein